jgi:hypothetical protein
MQFIINGWWPWLALWDDLFIIQFFIICTYIYIYTYKNIYYILLYTFINFFLIGIYLSIFQIELFTAFLWLVECSVLFVFLLLLFYVNVKGLYTYTIDQNYTYIFSLLFLGYIVLINLSSDVDSSYSVDMSFYGLIDNYYEAIVNNITNDLFGFLISYYFLNAIEFLFIGSLLLVGSVICVNLFIFNKNVRAQVVNSHLLVFNFFSNFIGFSFLRKQNLIKQGNNKASTKLFKKK